MQQFLILLPIFVHALIAGAALVYVLVMVSPRLRRVKWRPATRNGIRGR